MSDGERLQRKRKKQGNFVSVDMGIYPFSNYFMNNVDNIGHKTIPSKTEKAFENTPDEHEMMLKHVE